MKNIAKTVAQLIPFTITEIGVNPQDVLIHAEPVEPSDSLYEITGADTLFIDELGSRKPRNGTARTAMAALCILADKHDCRLALNPWAKPVKNALNQIELEQFYQSLGFGWRRDHVMVREPHVPTTVHVQRDVGYLPSPNRVELVLDPTPPPKNLTLSSFVIPIMADGRIVMAYNRRRGVEVPGGHIEPGESQEIAARREGLEETGAQLGKIKALGHLRMTSSGTVPNDWKYPHPLSYQSFFAAPVITIEPYTENDECLAPVILSNLSTLSPHVRIMALRSRSILGH